MTAKLTRPFGPIIIYLAPSSNFELYTASCSRCLLALHYHNSNMADSPGLSKAENQARIRKERREAKIKAGGSARLDKITGLGGGIKRG